MAAQPDIDALAVAMEALAHPTRLKVVKLLAKSSGGLPAGKIADLLGVPQSTMSTHLAKLVRAELVTTERQHTLLIQLINTTKFKAVLRRLIHLTGILGT